MKIRVRIRKTALTSANLCPASLYFRAPWEVATPGTMEDLLCTDLESADACDLVSGSITLNGCDCDGVRTLDDDEPAAAAAEEAEPTNIPSTDDSADSVTLNRETERSGGIKGS